MPPPSNGDLSDTITEVVKSLILVWKFRNPKHLLPEVPELELERAPVGDRSQGVETPC